MFETDTLTKVKTKKPSQYQVVLYNDDYTPMDFVVQILTHIFQKSEVEAHTLMLAVHKQGKAVCGVYSYEVAETKVMQVLELAAKQEYPLHCTSEKAP